MRMPTRCLDETLAGRYTTVDCPHPPARCAGDLKERLHTGAGRGPRRSRGVASIGRTVGPAVGRPNSFTLDLLLAAADDTRGIVPIPDVSPWSEWVPRL